MEYSQAKLLVCVTNIQAGALKSGTYALCINICPFTVLSVWIATVESIEVNELTVFAILLLLYIL